MLQSLILATIDFDILFLLQQYLMELRPREVFCLGIGAGATTFLIPVLQGGIQMSDAAVRVYDATKIDSGIHTATLTVESLISGRAGRPSRDSESLLKLAADLEALQLKRLVLKSARDEMEVTGALAVEQDKVFQRRFDEISNSTLNLADIVAMMPARTIAQLRAKAAFVLEFVEPGENAVLDRLIWSFATELIVYAAASMHHSSEGPDPV